MKQTAVQWLINELHEKQNGEGSNLSYNHIFDKAKEIEKQQIIDVYNDGNYDYGMGRSEPEEYYNETFKK